MNEQDGCEGDLTGVEFVEADTVFAQAREELRLYLPVNNVRYITSVCALIAHLWIAL